MNGWTKEGSRIEVLGWTDEEKTGMLGISLEDQQGMYIRGFTKFGIKVASAQLAVSAKLRQLTGQTKETW